jgi:NodT family efflux transporter outer membrane factor (OMF) lipoprotein
MLSKSNMKILNIITVGLVAVLMSSCGLYKKYERPEVTVNTSAVMRDAEQYANTTDSLGFGDVAWREVFTDPQLQELIEEGLENNLNVYKAVASVKQMEEALKCARLAFLPSLALAPNGTFSKVLTGDYKSDWNKSYALPISASWTLDIFGNILAQKRNAEATLAMTKDYEQAARSGVICGVANSYYTLLMLDRQLEILDEMEKLSKETWEMMKLQKDLGGARETSVVSAQAAFLKVQAQAVDMRRQVREVENALSLMIGREAQTISRGKLADQSLPTEFSTGYPLRILSIRPDVHAKEMDLAACFYDVQKARSSMYPSITISANGSYTNSLGSMIANPGQLIASFVGSLTQPLFANGRLTAQLRIAKIDYDVAEKEWINSILNAGAEISNCLIVYHSANDKGVLDRQQVEVLKKSVDYTRDLFKMGSSTYLEVLTAQSSLLNAEIAQVTDDFNKMQAVVNLYSALGGGRY